MGAIGPFNPPLARAAQLTTLPNGLQVLIQKDERFPLVSLRLYVRAGSAYETDGQAGISHLLEHMVFKGTEKRPVGGVATDIEGVGGYINAATSFDYTVFMVDVPAENRSLGMDVLQDMVFGARLDETELAQEKNVVLAELERSEDSPGNLLFKTLQDMVWNGTTYARPIIGYRETVNGFTRQDIATYIKQFYQPQNMLLVICGNVDPVTTADEAAARFGELRNDRSIETPPDLSSTQGSLSASIRLIKGKWNKIYFSAALPIPGFLSSETVGLDVLAHLLGGDATARLYRLFKYDKGLVDDISVSSMTLERRGMLHVQATLDPANLETFWHGLIQELNGLDAASFTDEELARAKLNLEDSLFRTKETLSGLASKIGLFQFFEGNPAAEENYSYDLNHVDREQLTGLIRRYVRVDRMQSALLLPESASVDASTLYKELPPAPAEANATQAAPQETAGKTEIIDLGGGRKVVLLPDPTLPYTSLDLVYQGGDSLLAPDEQGLADLSARVLTKGAAGRTAPQIAEFLADRAASVGARANRDLFTLSAKYPTRFTTDVLGLIKDILIRPDFAPEEATREKQNQIAEIKTSEDQPLALAFRHIFPFLFKNNSYSYFHLGDPEKIGRYTDDQIRGYWLRQQTQPWTLAVCGNLDKGAVLGLAQALADTAKPAKRKPLPSPTWSKEKRKDLHLGERNQTHLLLIFPATGMNHPDAPGLALLREILASQGGLLFRELRDNEGLGYSVTALLWQTPATGFLAFYIGTYPEREDEALAGFQRVVDQLRSEPLSQEEVLRGANLLRGEYYRDHQRLDSRSAEAAQLLTQGQPLELNKELIEQARKLSPADLMRLSRNYLHWGSSYLLRVAP